MHAGVSCRNRSTTSWIDVGSPLTSSISPPCLLSFFLLCFLKPLPIARFRSPIMSKGQKKRAESIKLMNVAWSIRGARIRGTLIKQGDKKFKTRYTGGSAIGAHYKDLLIISSSLNTPDMDF
ncbi:hypothetical protein ACGC1H_000029 [Rhizoctonia solani]